MDKSKIAAAVVIVIVLIVGVGAYVTFYGGAPSRTTSSTTMAPISGSTRFGGLLKVGVAASQQGAFAVPGTGMLHGIVVAVRWVNDNGGVVVQGTKYNLTLIQYDDQS